MKRRLIEFQDEALRLEEESVGGIRPRIVQRANLMRGIALGSLGVVILGVHVTIGIWALSWLELEWMAYAIAFGISASGAAGTAFLLQGILKIFKEHKHDALHALTYVRGFLCPCCEHGVQCRSRTFSC